MLVLSVISKLLVAFGLVVLMVGCSPANAPIGRNAEPPEKLSAEGVTRIELQSDDLNESSGVCVSADGKTIWSHNDSGGKPRIFGFDLQGKQVALVKISGAKARDWEDICSFTHQDVAYLAIADVGDNFVMRKKVQVYVVKQPKIVAGDFQKNDRKVVASYQVTYPGGAVNCEAMAFDPLRKSFVLATKENLRCRLYEIPVGDLKGKHEVEASLMETLVLPVVTGADISADGLQMVFTTYGPAAVLQRAAAEVGTDAAPWNAPVGALKVFELPARKQGESICFVPATQQLMVTSEFAPTPLWMLALPPSVAR